MECLVIFFGILCLLTFLSGLLGGSKRTRSNDNSNSEGVRNVALLDDLDR
jgi:hypothetical protein